MMKANLAFSSKDRVIFDPERQIYCRAQKINSAKKLHRNIYNKIEATANYLTTNSARKISVF